MKRLRAAALAMFFPFFAFGAERSTVTTVNGLWTYTQFGGGDVVVVVANPAPGCASGFWFKTSDAGFNGTYAALLSAFHTGTRVQVGGSDTDLWAGSGDTYCRLSYAALVP